MRLLSHAYSYTRRDDKMITDRYRMVITATTALVGVVYGICHTQYATERLVVTRAVV